MGSLGIKRAKIWINAFIPLEVKGNTKLVSDLPCSVTAPVGMRRWPLKRVSDPRLRGKTMFVTPLGCGLTDQRTFSSELRPTYGFGQERRLASRLHSEIDVDIASGRVVKQLHETGRSVQVNCSCQGVIEDVQASTAGMAFRNFRSELGPAGFKRLQFDINVSKGPATSNLIVNFLDLLGQAAYIDYAGSFLLELRSPTILDVSFVGYVDLYPAYEMYISVNDSLGLGLIGLSPPSGSSPTTHLETRQQVVFARRLMLLSEGDRQYVQLHGL